MAQRRLRGAVFVRELRECLLPLLLLMQKKNRRMANLWFGTGRNPVKPPGAASGNVVSILSDRRPIS